MRRNYFVEQFQLLFRNFFSITLFEFIYKAFGTYILFPVLVYILEKVMRIQIVDILSIENIEIIISDPIKISMVLLLLLLLSSYFLIEIATLTIGFKYSLRNETISIFKLIGKGFLNALRFLKPKNWIAFIMIYLFLPFLHFGLSSGIISLIYFGSFMRLYLGSELLHILIVVAIFIFTLITLNFAFVFVFFTEYKVNMITASLMCLKVLKKKYIATIVNVLSVVFSILLLILIGIVLAGGLSYGAYEGLNYIYAHYNTEFTAINFYRNLTDILSPIVVFFSCIFSVFITSFFFAGLYNVINKRRNLEYKTSIVKKTGKALLLSIIILVYSFFQGTIVAQSITDDNLIKAQNGGILTGHRGDLSTEVQNTAASFESAIANGADYIELDVRRTKDNVIIVVHDNNIKNLTGKDINVSETTYEELRNLVLSDPGRETTPNQHFLTLDEAIELVNGRAKLNIEIKQIQNGENYVSDVVQIIKNHGIEYECFVASSNYTYLYEVETIDPGIQTLYLTDSGNGDIENLYVDGLSLSTNAISEELIERSHLRGKLVHAWILEDADDILSMINYNVDYLITNDVSTGRQVLEQNQSTPFEKFIEILKLVIIHS